MNYREAGNQITYRGFCALGGLRNPRLYTRAVYVGKHFHHMAYWMAPL